MNSTQLKALKPALIQSLKDELQRQLDTALAAAQQAHESATDEENKAENKYDTLGLEAAYLAEGQSKRVDECQQAMQQFQHWQIPDYDDDSAIGLGALIALKELSNDNQKNETLITLFLCPIAGGSKLQLGQFTVQLLSQQAPLGKKLIDSGLGDALNLANQYYEIVALS